MGFLKNLLRNNEEKSDIYEGWMLETEDWQTSDAVTFHEIRRIAEAIGKKKKEHLIVQGPAAIRGCNYMQFCLDRAGTYHFEVCMKKMDGFTLYGRDGFRQEEVLTMIREFLDHAVIPELGGWEIVMETPDSGSTDEEKAQYKRQILQVLGQMDRETARETIRIRLDRDASPSILDSKIGGVPYWDKRREYPKTDKGEPLALLAQFNLEQLPANHVFPTTGMLQFFLCPNDLYGLSFTEADKQNEFRVVFHDTVDAYVTEGEILAMGIPTTREDLMLPVSGEFGVTFEKELVSMNPDDVKFDGIFREIAGEQGVSVSGNFMLADFLTEEEWEALAKRTEGHMLLGYPTFTQEDPRGEDSVYDTLLFQLDSDYGTGDVGREILWGDAGVGAFFINREDLMNLRFDRILYNWDCC